MARTRLAAIVIGLTVLGAAVGIGTRYFTRRPSPESGERRVSRLERPVYSLEQWIGRFLVSVINTHINPQAEFKTIHYQAPRTVTITGLTLTAGERQIMAIDQTVLELAEVPRRGQPVKVERIALTRPHFDFINDKQGGLIGWSGFVRQDVKRDPKSVPEGRRLSDVLVLRHVGIDDGRVIYDPNDGSQAMTLPGITLQLETPPATEPGWHQVVGTLGREPILHASIDGRINLDTSVLDVAKFDIKTKLDEKEYGTLPPALQQFLRAHQVRGELAANARGTMPLSQPDKATGQVQAILSNGRLAYRGFVLPVGRMELDADYPRGETHLRVADVAVQHENISLASARVVATTLSFPRAAESQPAQVGTSRPAPQRVIRIEELKVDGPQVVLARESSGGFVGWNHLAGADKASARDPKQIAQDVTDTVQLDRVQVHDAALRYQPGKPEDAFSIDGVDLGLKVTNPQEPGGGYGLEGTVHRGQSVTGTLRGSIGIPDLLLNLEAAEIKAQIGEKMWATLPQPARTWAEQHRVSGRLVMSGQGRIPLLSPGEAELRTDVQVADAGITVNGLELRVPQTHANAVIPRGAVNVEAKGISLRSGETVLASVDEASAELDGLPLAGRAVAVEAQIADGKRFGAKLKGRLDTQQAMLELNPLEITANLSSGHASVPLPVQEVLQHYRVGGQLTATIRGQAPLRDLARTEGRLEAGIKDATFTIGGTVWPTERVQATATLPGGPVEVVADNLQVVSAATYRKAEREAANRERILSVKRGSVRFETIPERGAPIQIARIELDTPKLLLVKQSDARFAGWSTLGQQGGGVALIGSPQGPAASQPSLVISEFQVRDGQIVYDAGDGRPVMSLPGIEMLLQIPRKRAEAGWYALSGTVRRDPIMNVAVDARINFDETLLELKSARVNAQLGPQQYGTLPPDIQKLLQQHQVQGQLAGTISGRFPLSEPTLSDARFNMDLNGGRLVFDDTAWPVDSLKVSGTMAAGRVDANYDARLVGGTAGGNLSLGLSGDQPFSLAWNIRGVSMEQILRLMDSQSSYSGIMSSSGQLRTRFADFKGNLSGNASVNISNAYLVRLPVIARLFELASVRHREAREDSADLNFNLRSDRADVQGSLSSPALKLEGSGAVFYDSRLDLDVRGQVLQAVARGVERGLDIGRRFGLRGLGRGLDRAVRPLGEVAGKVADQALRFRVSGTVSNPQVSVRPLGL